jgi:uncharacterized membrane protein YjfL (UPF0719 family)
VWTGFFLPAVRVCGLDVRQDVVERDNSAARTAAGGALIGMTLCFAGANLGEGPGWPVVVFCALLATGGWFLLWILLETLARTHEKITVERDPSAAMRLGALLIALGAILGRAVAGDWASAPATMHDFMIVGSPALLLVTGAVVIERALPSGEADVEHPAIFNGLAVALGYIVAAGGYIVLLGWW